MPDPTRSATIEQAIARGLEALGRLQAPDGSFPLRFRRNVAWWRRSSRWRPCGPLFATASILLGAGRLLPPATIARAVDYIRAQRRADGLWEYDPAIGIPPDADCTACSLAALALHGTPDDLTGGAALLRAFWRADAGPFRTWHAPGIWSLPERDEAVVNCNILLALELLGAPATPPEVAAVRRLLARTTGHARYYIAPSTMALAAHRAGLAPDALPPSARARPKARDLLGAAQWLSAQPFADPELTAALLAAQRRDGSWPAAAWVTAIDQPPIFWGSAAVSTALALEALVRPPPPARPRG